MKKILSIIAITLLLTSCDWINPDDPEFDYNLKSAKVITTNNNFGLELFNKILGDEEKANVMISPASISLALGMTYNGAETTTKDAFENVLNYDGLSREEVNEICRDLIEVLVTNSKGNLVEIANSIWYREGFPVHQDFLDMNSMYFDAEVRDIDFASSTAVDAINDWVSDKTHNKIDKIIDQLSAETMMLLINALYFNCVWEYEFDPDETAELTFYNDDQSEFGKVEMMKTESSFRYASTDDFIAVELPYKNEKFSMQLFLPTYESSVDELIELLDGEQWNNWQDQFSMNDEVQVCMPKFKFDYKRSIGPDLIDMGLGEAFTAAADFSGISDIPLLISQVIHKTFIDCNEEGTEAAAVTAVVMDLTSVGPSQPIVINFNRPFLFAITENSSKSIVFIGKVAEPEYE